ncbi:MAG: hypothetical protein KBD76_10230 [Bacteriovorax sp.]|nr:hypothetical protein [Bacteriovorax sp.]
MNKIFLLLMIMSFSVAAETIPFGRIVDIKGEGFISYEGKTRAIRKGDSIEVGAEIVIEHRGQVSFTDNADHRYHLGNSSSASVKSKAIELRSGDLWFQSLNKNDTYKIFTANATVDFQGGEAILTYDTVKGKSQIMVINGIMKLSNLRASELNLNVGEGHFSFVDNAYEEGAPRDPTPVGEKTYGQLVSLFSGLSPMDKNSEAIFKDHHQEHGAKREVASVKEEIHHPHSPEKQEDKQNAKLIEDYKEHLLAKTHLKKAKGLVVQKTQHGKKPTKSTKAMVHIFGQKKEKSFAYSIAAPVVKSRAPASVLEQEEPHTNMPYTKDFKDKNNESDKLINELKDL